jgi:hypothetical protein
MNDIFRREHINRAFRADNADDVLPRKRAQESSVDGIYVEPSGSLLPSIENSEYCFGVDIVLPYDSRKKFMLSLRCEHGSSIVCGDDRGKGGMGAGMGSRLLKS